MADEGTAPPAEGEKAGRPRNLYGYVRDAWKVPSKSFLKDIRRERLVEWRRGESFVRLEHPTRIDRARTLGWKAKPGFVVVRSRVRRGGLRKHNPPGGRKPKRRGMNKITMAKAIRRVAVGRGAKRYPNMEVGAANKVGEAGSHN